MKVAHDEEGVLLKIMSRQKWNFHLIQFIYAKGNQVSNAAVLKVYSSVN